MVIIMVIAMAMVVIAKHGNVVTSFGFVFGNRTKCK